ncbi:hypothetical protein HNR16_000420 [Pseudoclavibacter chungangensis]|uniref:hypothetical protein n=1 Tax=Pseudoclavibacter chungangensis TaxID=587635 RepID=UPI0015C713B1|nr:hypothetical protein [Pseudoclavibacter chungangensis]NYJ65632.1 hypothetical protein [Pseudoclavibacter chungangensis]
MGPRGGEPEAAPVGPRDGDAPDAGAAGRAGDDAAKSPWTRALDAIGWTGSNRNGTGLGATALDKLFSLSVWDRVFHLQKFKNWYATQRGNPGFLDDFPTGLKDFPMDKYKAWSAAEDIKMDYWVVTFGARAGVAINGAIAIVQIFKSGWGMIGRTGLFHEWRTGENLNEWKGGAGTAEHLADPSIAEITPIEGQTSVDPEVAKRLWQAWEQLTPDEQSQVITSLDDQDPEMIAALNDIRVPADA